MCIGDSEFIIITVNKMHDFDI